MGVELVSISDLLNGERLKKPTFAEVPDLDFETKQLSRQSFKYKYADKLEDNFENAIKNKCKSDFDNECMCKSARIIRAKDQIREGNKLNRSNDRFQNSNFNKRFVHFSKKRFDLQKSHLKLNQNFISKRSKTSSAILQNQGERFSGLFKIPPQLPPINLPPPNLNNQTTYSKRIKRFKSHSFIINPPPLSNIPPPSKLTKKVLRDMNKNKLTNLQNSKITSKYQETNEQKITKDTNNTNKKNTLKHTITQSSLKAHNLSFPQQHIPTTTSTKLPNLPTTPPKNSRQTHNSYSNDSSSDAHIIEWLDDLVVSFSRIPSPDIQDSEPIQTDSAFHFVHGE